MILDPKLQFGVTPQADLVKNSPATQVGSATSNTTTPKKVDSNEDTVRLSSTHGDLQALTSRLTAVPEVRSDRVQNFQQAVRSGQYQPASQKIADAILSDHVKLGNKA